MVDVGSGAGAPIIPLLILRPDVSAECVEPLGKRATFLRTASARLGLLSRMRVHETRLDVDRPQAFGETSIWPARARRSRPSAGSRSAYSLAPRVLVDDGEQRAAARRLSASRSAPNATTRCRSRARRGTPRLYLRG